MAPLTDVYRCIDKHRNPFKENICAARMRGKNPRCKHGAGIRRSPLSIFVVPLRCHRGNAFLPPSPTAAIPQFQASRNGSASRDAPCRRPSRSVSFAIWRVGRRNAIHRHGHLVGGISLSLLEMSSLFHL